MPGIIVPRKTVGEVQRLIENNEMEVKVELSESKIRFTLGDTVLTSKLIDGTFPDYARVIPHGNDKELTVDKKEFEQAVDRVSTVSSERGRAVKLSLSNGKLILSVTNPDFGQRDRRDRGRIRLPIRSISGSIPVTCWISPPNWTGRPRCSSSPTRDHRR